MTQEEGEGIGLMQGPPPEIKERREERKPPVAAPPTPPAPISRGTLTFIPVDSTESEVAAGMTTSLSVVLRSSREEKATIKLKIDSRYTSNYTSEGAEWRVWIRSSPKNREEIFSRTTEKLITLEPHMTLPITLDVEAPVGVRFRDRVDLDLSARWEKSDSEDVKVHLGWVTRQALLAIKTFRGYEREVADSLATKAMEKPGAIFSLMVPSAMRGYVFAEGMSFDGINDMLVGIRKARGLVKGETSLKEIEPLLEPKVTVEGFVEGAIVELISGPFKGEKARVKKIDAEKEHITVELIEAVVPIPVTIRGDHVRMVEKGGA